MRFGGAGAANLVCFFCNTEQVDDFFFALWSYVSAFFATLAGGLGEFGGDSSLPMIEGSAVGGRRRKRGGIRIGKPLPIVDSEMQEVGE
ncbi:hypothetical protein B0H12DRAFT_1160883 [Mycena haematopus]|nr:hypothetical protein B0H12DRAFT_1160883 [Mycena haematopus]